ncbi:MAG: Xaa-Pro aminopeptidase [Actinomycetota bacterium]|jgi:Xaa-Pro dipeptidase|nr:Xaa-Pro aminopeptidase [Actinomycetota bacterium]
MNETTGSVPLSREERTDAMLEKEGLDAILASTRASIRHLSGVDYPGVGLVSDERSFVLWTRDGKRTLLAPGWGADHANQTSLDVSLCVHPQEPIDHLIEVLGNQGLREGAVGIESEFLATAVADRVRTEFPGIRLMGVDKALLRNRIVKSPDEVEKIRKACHAAELGMIQAIGEGRTGMTDREFADLLSEAVLANGAEAMAWIAFRWGDGEQRMSMIDRPIQDGELINIEMGCSIDGYHADVQRMVSAGSVSDEIVDTNRRLGAVLKRSLQAMKPGTPLVEIQAKFDEDARRENLDVWDVFFLGHGIGLDPHEDYLIWAEAEPDLLVPDQSTFALEPAVDKPTILSLEDTVYVTEGGNEILSCQREWPDLPQLGQKL